MPSLPVWAVSSQRVGTGAYLIFPDMRGARVGNKEQLLIGGLTGLPWAKKPIPQGRKEATNQTKDPGQRQEKGKLRSLSVPWLTAAFTQVVL